MNTYPTIRFSAIGLNHPHIYGQTNMMLRAGAELVSFYTREKDLAAPFFKAFPQSCQANTKDEILEDESIQLVLSATIPNERASLGKTVMEHRKDYFCAKPGFTNLDQLSEIRRIQAATKQIYFIYFSERLENPATVKAGELVKSGAIGKVIQTIGLGSHRIGNIGRPSWFFIREKYGGILTDIGAHQIDQFLFFTNSTFAEIVSSQVANYKFPQYPELEDFGDMTLRGNGGTGYSRVDWHTPDGLNSFGDGRLIVLGTDGYIEVRKYCDIAGRDGADHLFLVDHKGMHYFDCKNVYLPSGQKLVEDIIYRTQKAMPQEHIFLTSKLAIKAELNAIRLEGLLNE